MERATGFEPATYSMASCRSTKLSYARTYLNNNLYFPSVKNPN